MGDQPQARRYCWTDLAADAPMALLSRRRVIGEKAMISRVELAKGCFVPTHHHENEQFVCLISGKLRFGIGSDGPGQEKMDLAAGEVLLLPSNVPHSAEALEDTIVLDVFSPPSETTGIDRG